MLTAREIVPGVDLADFMPADRRLLFDLSARTELQAVPRNPREPLMPEKTTSDDQHPKESGS
jgi:hypothetical protein